MGRKRAADPCVSRGGGPRPIGADPVSAHPISHRRGWLSALAAHVTDFVFEETAETAEPEPKVLEPHPVVAVVSAGPNSGATTVARLLAAELATRADGAAIATSTVAIRRSAPPSRAAVRLATALAGAAVAQPCGRLCLVRIGRGAPDAPAAGEARGADAAALANVARYLAPVVLDLPPDGSAAGIASIADGVVVVTGATAEPALLDAVAAEIGGDPIKVVNRVTDPAEWAARAAISLPDSRIAARAASMGTRPLGPLGAAVAALADKLVASP
jgi:hypothetical protein